MSADITMTVTPSVRPGDRRRVLGSLEDVGLLLLLVLAFPLVVLAAGAPVALVVHLFMAIGRRWW
jgi:hypothetical protein